MSLRFLSLVAAGLLALAFLSQGLTGPFEKDEESRPASIVADLLNRGDWLLPADSYGEVTRKPPLYYWLSAAIARIRGAALDEAGTRVVSLAAAAALAVVVMGYAGVWLGGPAGWLAFLFLLGSYGFASHAGYARTDMLFTLFLFSAYCLLFPAVEGEPSPRFWLPAGVSLGLAVLTKGPLALALCVLGMLIYLALVRRNPIALARRPWPWLTLAVSVALAGAWYLPAYLRTRGGIASVQLMQENVGHLLPEGLGGTGEAGRPIYYIMVRFVGACFPLSLYIPALILGLRPLGKVGRPLLYQLGLLIAVLGLFSIASAKRDDYILPAFPPFAIVLAGIVTAARSEISPLASRVRDLAGGLAGAVMLTGAMAGLLLSWEGGFAHRLAPHLQSSDAAYLGLFVTGFWRGRQALSMIAIAIASAVSLIAWRRANPRLAAEAVAIASIAAVSLWIGILRPGLAARRTFKDFALQMRLATGGQPVFTPGGPDYEISYYYCAPIQPLALVHQDTPRAKAPYLLIWSDRLKQAGGQGDAGRVVLTSRAALDGRRLLLLKVDANRFEPSLKRQ